MEISEIAKIHDRFSDPREVWKAVEGDPSELIALLRSERKLTRSTREALADWIDGTLKPMKLHKGRPTKNNQRFAGLAWSLSDWKDLRGRPLLTIDGNHMIAGHHGYDLTTDLGLAGWRYEYRRAVIRHRGWHLKRAGKLYRSSEWLKIKIAERHGIDLETFSNYLKRPKVKVEVVDPRPYYCSDRVEERRWEVAKECRVKTGK